MRNQIGVCCNSCFICLLLGYNTAYGNNLLIVLQYGSRELKHYNIYLAYNDYPS